MTNQLQHQPRRNVDLRIPAIEKYAYCLCLHVKPTTIFIAVFKLIRSLVLASILLNNEFSVHEPSSGLGFGLDKQSSTQTAVRLLGQVTVATVSAGAIYAVISNRANLLMPLYACLLVDFFYALPAFYTRDLDLSEDLNLKDYSHRDPHFSRYPLLILATITVIARIYFLCVIWKCYRYLRLIELVSPSRLGEIYPRISRTMQYPIVRVLGSSDATDLDPGYGGLAPPSYDSIAANTKPPNYEEAMKSTDAGRNSLPCHAYQSTTATNANIGPEVQQRNSIGIYTTDDRRASDEAVSPSEPRASSHNLTDGLTNVANFHHSANNLTSRSVGTQGNASSGSAADEPYVINRDSHAFTLSGEDVAQKASELNGELSTSARPSELRAKTAKFQVARNDGSPENH